MVSTTFLALIRSFQVKTCKPNKILNFIFFLVWFWQNSEHHFSESLYFRVWRSTTTFTLYISYQNIEKFIYFSFSISFSIMIDLYLWFWCFDHALFVNVYLNLEGWRSPQVSKNTLPFYLDSNFCTHCTMLVPTMGKFIVTWNFILAMLYIV